MITRDQALTLDTFHYPFKQKDGTPYCYVYRRNGQTRVWKTRPDDFRVPVKWGIHSRGQGQFTHNDAHQFYAQADCPVCHGTKH